MTDHLQEPKWLSDIRRLRKIRSAFVIAGRPGDKHVYLSPTGGDIAVRTNRDALTEVLALSGTQLMASYDIVAGLTVRPIGISLDASVTDFATALGLPDATSQTVLTPDTLSDRLWALERAQTLNKVANTRFCYAAVIELGSRFLQSQNADLCLAKLLKRSETAQPVLVNGQATQNPLVIWVDTINEVPAWFINGSQKIEALTVGAPTYDERHAAASHFSGRISSLKGDQNTTVRNRFIRDLTARSSSLSIADLDDLSQLCRDHKSTSADDMVRSYQLGDMSLVNPWKSPELKKAVRSATISAEVMGQDAAVAKTMDIVKRAIAGMSGAQASSSPNRPRGVLFFAGPTGTGKTELAKQLAGLIVGDPESIIRFDMSEYSSEHHEARLLGAPPGYTGHQAGGQLTDAVRSRPFSVVLFDEIEKAHPRILDKFLQILEDGRITDGRGQTAYFSESLLVFTSNLGIIHTDPKTQERIELIQPGMSYPDLEKSVRNSIEDHFRVQIGRPELLNRLGDNIVIFDFISPKVGLQILDKSISNVAARVKGEHGLELRIDRSAKDSIAGYCLGDLRNGGRGIGMRLETVLINPLSRILADKDFVNSLTITAIDLDPETNTFAIVAS